MYIPKYKSSLPKCGEDNMNAYVPCTGGHVDPYEVTRYERILSCIGDDECNIEIICKDEAALLELRHFIFGWIMTNLIQVTINTDPNSRPRISIETHHLSITDKIKDFIDEINKQQSLIKTSNKPVFQYGHDVIPLGQIGEVKINPQGIEFTCNVGRKNGKSMASKDLINTLYGNYLKKDIDITKEMKDNMIGYKLCPVPKKIIFSGPKCIVLWVDGTKTIVSCSENDQWDEYAAYCAALAKKIYGTTSAVHRMVDKKSNAKEYRESQEVSVHIDGAHSLGKALAEAMYKAMEPFIKEDNDEPSEH